VTAPTCGQHSRLGVKNVAIGINELAVMLGIPGVGLSIDLYDVSGAVVGGVSARSACKAQRRHDGGHQAHGPSLAVVSTCR
jgi:hypothetical protein